MKKLFIIVSLIVSVITLTNVRQTQAEVNTQLKHKKPPLITYVGHWYYSITSTDYSVYVYQDDPTSVAKVSTNASGFVDATGTYDPDTKVATLESSIINFSHELSYP